MSVSRRQVLLLGGLGVLGAGALTVPLSSIEAKTASRLADRDLPRPFQTALTIPPILQPSRTGIDPVDGSPVNYYNINQQTGRAKILPRHTTPILGYNGIFPGPTIDLDQGTKAVVRIHNKLPLESPMGGHELNTSVHLHGSASLPQYDGYASDTIAPGFAKDYHYPNFQPARTLWYHDHGVHFTAENAYAGLAAHYHMHDPIERALLPQGEFDVPLTLTDAMFAQDGTLGYDDNTHSGLWGDVILANGQPWPVMQVKRRIYRFRILNASVSRSFRPTLSTGEPVTVVATDGGLMPEAQQVASWRHAGAERYEILVDFSKYKAGDKIELRNLSNKNNIDYLDTDKIMQFWVTDDEFDTSDPTALTLPTVLDPNSPVMNVVEPPNVKVRNFRVKKSDTTNLWTVGDFTWADIIKSGYKQVCADPELDAVEIWEFQNNSGGWFHPMHIHLIDFKILSRKGGRDGGDGFQPPFAYERGPKDVVYVGEGETVRLLCKFGPHRGKYMIHCHNLPHEDHDMMTQFSVGLKDGDPDPNDPMTAAPAWFDDGTPL
jgi:FtsP/CotA-like multicopper oxidase with cupredoxin domain